MSTLAGERAVLHAACRRANLDDASAQLLSSHATSVYLLYGDVVARVHRSSDDRARAMAAVYVAGWLTRHGFPATEPVADPVDVDDVCVTFWRYYPQQDGQATPSAAYLGSLLRDLHGFPDPPVALPEYEPLTHVRRALAASTVLANQDRTWLTARRVELLESYRHVESELGVGWVHGDAYPGNTLWDGDQVRLGDWDEVAIAPRELDLINTHQGVRMGRSATERAAFTQAYGWDVTAWSGYSTLREMRDLHTLGAFIERAERGDTGAAGELQHRIHTLRTGDVAARWHSA